MDAVLLDAGGAAPAAANAAALRAAGIDPKRVAAVVAEAGPRFRDTLPASIDAIRREPEARRAIVEPCLWPWPAEWPGEHPWSRLPSHAILAAGESQTVSLTVENRGDAPARGRYRLKIVPAAAARFKGPAELPVALKPGGRVALETVVVATGKAKAFRIEAVATGAGLVGSAIFYSGPESDARTTVHKSKGPAANTRPTKKKNQ